jgi:hypothetical protein
MGGKIWSVQEERYFWQVVIPRSAKRVGTSQAGLREKSWAELAQDMKSAMGDNRRREYTGTMLCEYILS